MNFHENDLVNYVLGTAGKDVAAAIRLEAQTNGELQAEIALLRSTFPVPQRPVFGPLLRWVAAGAFLACAVLTAAHFRQSVHGLEQQLAVQDSELGKIKQLAAANDELRQKLLAIAAENEQLTTQVYRLRADVASATRHPLPLPLELPLSESVESSRADPVADGATANHSSRSEEN